MKIQAEVLIPLVRKLQDELGQQQANELVQAGLTEWAQGLGKMIADQGKGTSVEKMTAAAPLFARVGVSPGLLPRLSNDRSHRT